MPDIIADLEKLADLRDRGLLTEAEFTSQKARLLGGAPAESPSSTPPSADAAPSISRVAQASAGTTAADGEASKSPLSPPLGAGGRTSFRLSGKLLGGAAVALIIAAYLASHPGSGSPHSTAYTPPSGNTAAGSSGDIILTRDAEIGARLGMPGPRTCSTHAEPRSGALSAAQARAYVICGVEGVSGSSGGLTLLSNVQVQSVNGRPYNDNTDTFDGIDTSKTVYDIRGSSVVWSCAPPGGVLAREQLCTRSEAPDDEGRCYQITSGDWRCSWADLTAPMTSTDTRLRVPPPSGSDAE